MWRTVFHPVCRLSAESYKSGYVQQRFLRQTCVCLGIQGTEIKMPVLSPTMNEGRIVKWLKKEGEAISSGDVICEVQTDKAVVAMEMEEEGILAKILVPEDSRDIKIGELIALMVEEGENWKDVEIPTSFANVSSSHTVSTDVSLTTAPTSGLQVSNRISPSVRNLLHQYDLDIKHISPTGPHNILLKGDILNHIEINRLQPRLAKKQTYATSKSSKDGMTIPADTTTASGTQTYVDIELSSMRRTIAKRLTESKTTIPHAYMSVDCNVSSVIAYRQQLKAQKINISINDIIIKAASLALKRIPAMNAIFDVAADRPVQQTSVDISIAVATPNGLITPIIKQANHLSIVNIGGRMRHLAEKARDGKLQPDEFIGGSFSISNLGMFGVTEFSAVINPPQAAILAIGSPRSIVESVGSVQQRLTCTLSYDSRVANEEQVAEFLEVFKENLEQPAELDKQDGSSHRRLSAFA